MMRRRQSSDWARTRKGALAAAETLTRESSSDLPINLLAIAKKQRVKQVQFRPLLVAGGISVSADGFSIYVNCDPGEGQQLTEEFVADGTGSSLPRRLRARARFTIAHEIAHTLLYNLETRPPQPRIALKVPASLRTLERVCNIVAGALLLPAWVIKAKIEDTGLVEAYQLGHFAERGLVSSDTLIRRLRKINPADHPECIVAAVEKKGPDLTILSISRHYRFRELFTEAIPGAPLTSFVYHPDLVAFGGELTSVHLNIRYTGGVKMPYQFDCESRASRSATNFLVTARPVREVST
jgi:hypothetical protein